MSSRAAAQLRDVVADTLCGGGQREQLELGGELTCRARCTLRRSRSIARPSKRNCRAPAAAPGAARRRMVYMRASSSRGSKGLGR
jgi:hypothetical protein